MRSFRFRHSSIVVIAAAVLCLMASCSGPSAGQGGPGGPVDPADDAVSRTGDGARDPGGVDADVVSRGEPCVDRACMYHEGTDSYHLCLNSGGGDCFHHGGSCLPADGCMYDRKSASYRTCDKTRDGGCASFGKRCDPPGRCWYNPADKRHHVCEARGADGRCSKFGALCDVPR